MTRDPWHMIFHMWHVTLDFSSLALMVWNLWCFEDLEEKRRTVAVGISDRWKLTLPLCQEDSYNIISSNWLCHSANTIPTVGYSWLQC